MTSSPFSIHNPKLQTAYDATSLRALMTCARYYQLTMLDGWGGSGVHIEFGGFYASAVEHWKKARLEGKTHDESTRDSLRWLLRETWVDIPLPGTSIEKNNASEQRTGPWGGTYETQWHCSGTEPYHNSKGNRAKCPWSLKGHWYPASGPHTCGECRSAIQSERRWSPYDGAKHRVSLVRTFLWYCFEQPERADSGGLQPYAFSDGTPAVELSFALPSPWVNGYGESIILAGHIDSLGSFGEELFITDNKTTGKALNEAWAQTFSPNVQVDLYDLVGSILYPELKIRGVVIEGAQVLKTEGPKFGLHIIHKTETQREEYLGELEWWIKQAEIYARDNYWPMNRSACYLCPFKKVCSSDPALRERILKQNFQKREWNPLEIRI